MNIPDVHVCGILSLHLTSIGCFRSLVVLWCRFIGFSRLLVSNAKLSLSGSDSDQCWDSLLSHHGLPSAGDQLRAATRR